jgi:ATP-dependent Clp protease ATP-binding subunit ClpC
MTLRTSIIACSAILLSTVSTSVPAQETGGSDMAVLRNTVVNLLDAMVKQWRDAAGNARIVVTAEDVMAVVSKTAGVPLKRMEGEELTRLIEMEQEIERTVVGQKMAVKTIANALRRSRVDLKDPRRPIGSFLFLGPTGVGKTLLAKALAEFMFHDANALIQVDMSEYMEKFNVSRLVGSPPGYVGHEEGGQLTERVRRRPYSVVLFDEVEKAHPDVMHTLLQILEEGHLTDSNGRKVDFRNTIMILTSNLGYDTSKRGEGLGFHGSALTTDYDSLKLRMIDEAKRVFKPELLNRFDDVVVFRQLDRSDMADILEIELKRVCDRVAGKGKRLVLGKPTRAFLLEKGFDPAMGARPLRRTIERFVETPLAEEFLRGGLEEGDVVEAVVEEGRIEFRQKVSAKK